MAVTTSPRRKATTGTPTTVAASATSVTLLAANDDRVHAVISNDSTAVLYVGEFAVTSASSYSFRLEQNEAVVIDDYNGIITGIWTSATGDAKVTEATT